MWSVRRAIVVAAVTAGLLSVGFALGRATRPAEQVPPPSAAEQAALREGSPRVSNIQKGVQVPKLRLPRPQEPDSRGGGTTPAPESDGSEAPTNPDSSEPTTPSSPPSGGEGNGGGRHEGGEGGGVIGGGID